MGQRANLVIIDAEDTSRSAYELYYCHWCANTLDKELFWGPERGLDFIRQHRRIDTSGRSDGRSGWLDEVWSEGGVVMDIANKTLLLFGGEDILYDIPLRRLYLELLQYTWPDWEIQWAEGGIADQVTYLGLPEELVLDSDAENPSLREEGLSLDLPEEKDWTDSIGSIRWEDGHLSLFPLNQGFIYELLYYGIRLLNLARHEVRENALKALALEEWTKAFPQGGFHIDAAQKVVEFWCANGSPRMEQRIRRFWPEDWTVIWWCDRFEFQLERTDGNLTFPERSRVKLMQRLSEILGVTDDAKETEAATVANGASLILDFMERLADEGHETKINPLAIEQTSLPPLSLSAKKQIWKRTIEAFARS